MGNRAAGRAEVKERLTTREVISASALRQLDGIFLLIGDAWGLFHVLITNIYNPTRRNREDRRRVIITAKLKVGQRYVQFYRAPTIPLKSKKELIPLLFNHANESSKITDAS